MRAIDATPAIFYGLPKIGFPLRPAIVLRDTPTYNLAKWLAQFLSFLTPPSNSTVTSSTQFLTKLQGLLMSWMPSMWKTTSCAWWTFSLYETSLHETVDCMCSLVESSQISIHILIDILKQTVLLCTENVSFPFLGQSYQQIDGVVMGSPLGPILADLFMHKIESLSSDHIFRLL